MVELSRRLFLGGALSVLAASTFEVKPSAANIPRIWADDQHDDTSGLAALFRKEPVVFAKENIGLDNHGGLIFHNGVFRITQTIDIPRGAVIKVESITLDVRELEKSAFALRGGMREIQAFTGLWTKWRNYTPEWPGLYEGEKIIRPRIPARGVPDRANFLEVTDVREEEYTGLYA